MTVAVPAEMAPLNTFEYKSFSTAPVIIHGLLRGEKPHLGMKCRVAEADCAVPGRGLEPLRISPPDPKSGASANSATPANCDAYELRCVGRWPQIALVSFLGFLRQIEGCLRKRSSGPFSFRSSSAHRDKAA